MIGWRQRKLVNFHQNDDIVETDIRVFSSTELKWKLQLNYRFRAPPPYSETQRSKWAEQTATFFYEWEARIMHAPTHTPTSEVGSSWECYSVYDACNSNEESMNWLNWELNRLDVDSVHVEKSQRSVTHDSLHYIFLLTYLLTYSKRQYSRRVGQHAELGAVST